MDGTAINTKGIPTWSFKGYNPIKKGAKSYFPLIVHIAESGHSLAIISRSGNVHDSNRAGKIAWNYGKKVLQMTKNKKIELLYEQILNSIEEVRVKNAA